jgi:orotidine-5'-phosphate decarboxylase
MNSKIFLALDVPTFDTNARSKVHALAGAIFGIKVGLQLFTAEGPQIVRILVEAGFKVFLDLKFKDIPNTVAGAVAAAVAHGVYIVNVHIGGEQMLRNAVAAAKAAAEELHVDRPLVIGITVLTSEDENDLIDDGYPEGTSVRDLVIRRALRAKECGLDGVVASPQEASEIRAACGPDFVIITPGIQLAKKDREDDQKRTGTAEQAIRDGANYIVVGRPIMNAENSVMAALDINEEVELALAAPERRV